MEPHLNFLALLVAGLVPMIMGMIYYHPSLMGTKWMIVNDFVKEKMTPGVLDSFSNHYVWNFECVEIKYKTICYKTN